MAADGRITPEEAVEAMVSRQGEVFDQARSRVGTQQGVRWLFSAFLADLYPEGEKTQRQNADEYYQAIEKWTSGDTDAMQKFYDEHPDYEARMAALRDPQERLKSYLISEVWDRWNEADRVTKKAAAEQLKSILSTSEVLTKEEYAKAWVEATHQEKEAFNKLAEKFSGLQSLGYSGEEAAKYLVGAGMDKKVVHSLMQGTYRPENSLLISQASRDALKKDIEADTSPQKAKRARNYNASLEAIKEYNLPVRSK